jgi:hypothetical protein
MSGEGVEVKNAILKVPAIGYESIIKIHGFIMFFAWGVLPFFAIYIARYMKHLGHKWYLLHVAIMVLVLVLTLSSFILIVLYKPPPHFLGPHRVNNVKYRE